MDEEVSVSPLKVAVLSSASGGGAGIAARRVADALNLADNINADFIDMVALGARLPDDAAPPGNMSNHEMTNTHFTVEFPGFVRGWVIDLLRQYDVLNIHWASFLLGLAEIDELSRIGMPILFTCHDYYYFTGGCHYPATCKNLDRGCIGCPQVNRDYCSTSVIARNLEIKKKILTRPNVHLSAPSAFLVNEAVEAGMISTYQSHVLRNPYFPVPGIARVEREGPRKIVLLADSMAERRKAMPLAIQSLGVAWRRLLEKQPEAIPFSVEIIGKADEAFKSAVAEAGFTHILRGKITNHEEIARLLSGCDFLLTCSFEDNWPNVLVEAGAYGVIPIVGPGHGCEEFVKVFQFGFVADEYTAESFATTIEKLMDIRGLEGRQDFSERVRSTHDKRKVARQYAAVLNKLQFVT